MPLYNPKFRLLGDWPVRRSRPMQAQWLLVALLGVACGGRTALEVDPTPSMQASGGSGGAPPSLSWDEIVWDDEVVDEAVVYLWTGSVTNTWAVVSAGAGAFRRMHWDGMRWTRTVPEGHLNAAFDEGQVWGAENDQAFGGSSKNLQRWSGQTWMDWAGTPDCRVVGGRVADDLWCATESELWRLEGGHWTHQAMGGIRGILARARDDVWVWGEQGASHFDGARWSLELRNLVRRVSASGPRDVWAIQDGHLLHSTGPGSAWTQQNPTGGQISSVWSESQTNTWIVAAGTAMRWNGSSWRVMPLSTQDERLLISGSTEDIWIAGTQMLIHGRPVRR